MSELAKSARAAMKKKAERLGAAGSTKNAGPGDDPSKSIDASGWREPVMNADAKTGMRPVSRRQFKSGGAVSGEHTPCRADRKARKSGGGVNAKINRDVRAANHEIAQPHEGGFAHGGATNFRKQMHGEMGVAENQHGRRNGIGKFHRSHKASGGATGYGDIAGMRPKGDRIARKEGGKTKGKGKTQIIIGIHAGGAHQPPQMPPGTMPHPAAPPPAPPPMMPPPGAGGPPMGAGAPPGMPPGMGMPMPRKSGGKVVGAKYSDASIDKAEKVKSPKNIPAGGGGLGRLAKRSIAQKDGFKAL